MHAAIVIVGDNTHDRQWIEYEAGVILSAQKPVVVGRIPKTTGAAPTQLRNHAEVPLEPDALKAVL